MTLGADSTTDDVLAGTDLTGQVWVVTGATTGLGLETARVAAARGATVVMAVRNPDAATDAQSAVGPDGHLVACDLTSLASVRAAAAEIAERWPRVDVLVANAGVMATPAGVTDDGFELQLGTNHLGHFLFVARLAPALADDGRVVVVSSRAHFISGVDVDDPHYRTREYDKWQAYGQSKTANILFARGLAQRGFTARSVHPGMIGTALYRYLPDAERAAVEARPAGSEGTVKSIPQGAATIVWAAVGAGIPNGAYLADCAVTQPAEHATDPETADWLWAFSEREVGEVFPAREGVDKPDPAV